MVTTVTKRNFELKELSRDELKYQYEVKVSVPDLAERVREGLAEKRKTFKMAHYHAGRVPEKIIQQKYGKEVAEQKIGEVVQETLKAVFEEHKIRPALPPEVNVKEHVSESNNGGPYIIFTVAVEVVGEVPELDLNGIEIKSFNIEITNEDMERALNEYNEVMGNFKDYVLAEEGHTANKGDALIIDFKAAVDGKELPGGNGEGLRIILGEGASVKEFFTKEFEEHLIGAKKGEHKTFNIPISGRDTHFEVTIREILTSNSEDNSTGLVTKTDNLTDSSEMDSMIRTKIESEFAALAHLYMKKELFDQIDAKHKFKIPSGVLKLDFDNMWNELGSQLKEANPNQSEEQIKASYEQIAARRVRLGLILAEVARKHKIEVTEQELQQAVMVEAMQQRGGTDRAKEAERVQKVFDHYSNRKNLENLRGPLLEEKVVSYILSQITVHKQNITSKEFIEMYASELQLPTGIEMSGG